MRRHAVPLSLLGLIFIMAFGILWMSNPSRAQTDQSAEEGCCGPDSAIAPREVDFPYYSLRDGYDSTLLLISDSPKPLDFALAVRSASGQTALAPPMTIQPQEKMPINLRALLTQLGADTSGDFAEGSVAIYFEGTIMPLAGQLTMTNPSRRLILESEMVDNSPGLGLLPKELHALWWGIGGGRDARIVVTNTSGSAVVADVYLDFLGERHSSAAPLTFRPHETKVLSVTDMLGEFKSSPAEAPEGGISIISRSQTPALIAQGKITDPATGFSTTLNFPDPSLQRASAVHASGVPIGKPTDDSPYAGLGTFTPHVIVRNLTGAAQSVTITVEYPGEEGPAQVPLASLPLAAFSTKDISLDAAFGLLPLPLPFCSIRVQYSGLPGSAMAEVSSIEARGDLVVDSRVANEGDSWAGSGAHPWHLDDETESILFLTNMSGKDARICFHVKAGGVIYYLTDLKLAPHETRAIDLRKLRDAQKPDYKGNTIPADATDGSVIWVRLDNIPVMGRLLVMQHHKAMASNYDCTTLRCSPGLTSVTTATDTSAYLVGQSHQHSATAVFTDANSTPHPYGVTTDGATTWSSSLTSVATVNNSTQKGLVVGQGGGTATISAQYCDYTYTWSVVEQMCIEHARCYTGGSGHTVKVPHYLQVISDVSGGLLQCPSTIGRQIKMKVVDAGNTTVGTVRIKESFLSVSNNTCGTGQPQPSACADTDNANSEFTDGITVNCNSVGGSCGYNITYEWQWCPSGLPAVDIGKFIETVHANAITVNGVATPNGISAGTNIYP